MQQVAKAVDEQDQLLLPLSAFKCDVASGKSTYSSHNNQLFIIISSLSL